MIQNKNQNFLYITHVTTKELYSKRFCTKYKDQMPKGWIKTKRKSVQRIEIKKPPHPKEKKKNQKRPILVMI